MRPGSAKSIRAHKSCKAFLRCVRQQGANWWHRCRNIHFVDTKPFVGMDTVYPFSRHNLEVVLQSQSFKYLLKLFSMTYMLQLHHVATIQNETLKLTHEIDIVHNSSEDFSKSNSGKIWFPKCWLYNCYIYIYILFEIRLPTTPHESLWPDPQQNSQRHLLFHQETAPVSQWEGSDTWIWCCA